MTANSIFFVRKTIFRLLLFCDIVRKLNHFYATNNCTKTSLFKNQIIHLDYLHLILPKETMGGQIQFCRYPHPLRGSTDPFQPSFHQASTHQCIHHNHSLFIFLVLFLLWLKNTGLEEQKRYEKKENTNIKKVKEKSIK